MVFTVVVITLLELVSCVTNSTTEGQLAKTIGHIPNQHQNNRPRQVRKNYNKHKRKNRQTEWLAEENPQRGIETIRYKRFMEFSNGLFHLWLA
jgi:hypothetical protein